jgi:hypothetical protein
MYLAHERLPTVWLIEGGLPVANPRSGPPGRLKKARQELHQACRICVLEADRTSTIQSSRGPFFSS